jgi:hypothetical protein
MGQLLEALRKDQPAASAETPAPAVQGSLLERLRGEKPTEPDERGALRRGLSSGWENLKGTGLQIKALAKSLYGDDEGAAADFERSLFRNMKAGKLAPKYSKIEDVLSKGDFGDFMSYAGFTLGEQMPNLLGSIGTAGLGGFAGRKIGEMKARQLLTDELAERLVKKYASRGAITGAAAASGAIETGASGQELFEATGKPQPGLALAAGAAKTVLDIVTPTALAKRFGLAPDVASRLHDALFNRLKGKGAIRRALGGALGAGLAETGTEGLQELIDVTTRSFVDENTKILSKETASRMLNAGAAAFIVASPIGAAAGVAGGREQGPDQTGGLEKLIGQQPQPVVPPVPPQPGQIELPLPPPPPKPLPPVVQPPVVQPKPPVVQPPVVPPKPVQPQVQQKLPGLPLEKHPVYTTGAGPYLITDTSGVAPAGRVELLNNQRAIERMSRGERRNMRIFRVPTGKKSSADFTAGLDALPTYASEVTDGLLGLSKGQTGAIALVRRAILERNTQLRKALLTESGVPDLTEANRLYEEAIKLGFRFQPSRPNASLLYVGAKPLETSQLEEIGTVTPHYELSGSVALANEIGDKPNSITSFTTSKASIKNKVSATNSGYELDLYAVDPSILSAGDVAIQTLLPLTSAEKQAKMAQYLKVLPHVASSVAATLKQRFYDEVLNIATPNDKRKLIYQELMKQGLRYQPNSADFFVVGPVPPAALKRTVAPALSFWQTHMMGLSRSFGVEYLDRFIGLRDQTTGKPYDPKTHQPGTVAVFGKSGGVWTPSEMKRFAKFTELITKRMMPNAKLVLSFETSVEASTYHPIRNGFGVITMRVGAVEKMDRASSTLTHELGHALAHHELSNVDSNVLGSLYSAFQRDMARAGRETASDWMQYFFRGYDLAMNYWGKDTRPAATFIQKNFYEWPYSFDEWIAEQTARWFTGSQQPMRVMDKFFSRLARKLKEIFSLSRRTFPTAEIEVETWLNSLYARRQMPMAAPAISPVAMTDVTTEGVVENAKADPLEAVPRTAGGDYLKAMPFESPEVRGQVVQQADKFNKWIDATWQLLQIADKNLHILGLQRYVGFTRSWHISKMHLVSRAEGRLKQWRRLGKEMASNLSNFMFDIDKMVYLQPGENARHPNNAELLALAKKHNLNQAAFQTYLDIKGDFLHVLDKVEAAAVKDATKSITDPASLSLALINIKSEMRQLRSKPYFPHERFGDWTVAVRDAAGELVFYQQFESKRAALRAERSLHLQFPNHAIRSGKLPAELRQFQGIPPTILKGLANKLQLTQAQRDHLDELIFDLSPANSFTKHFKKRSGIEGYSLDGMRAYASYFMHAGSHVARLEWRQDLEDSIKAVELSARAINMPEAAGEVAKRQGIADWLKQHLEYIMNPPNEWSGLRSLAFQWYLGFAVDSALINLTQIPMVAAPYLASRFGDAKALAALTKASLDLRKGYRLTASLPKDEQDAIAKGVEQGFLDESQAAELAATAQGGNMARFLPGTEVQRTLMWLADKSAWMFQQVEKLNRRVVFRAAYRLAKAQPGTQYLNQLVASNQMLYQDLLGLGWKPENAAAFIAGRDAVERSQFEYASWARPKFMRGKKGVLFTFFMFQQNMLWMFKNSPGGTRALFAMLAAAGLMGLPGADDLDQFIKYAAAKLFGRHFSPEHELRKLLTEITDRPDLILHGLGRESFGLTALGNQLGMNVPGFDFSSRLGMGRLVPGAQPLFDPSLTYEEKFTKVAEDVLGASYAIPLRMVRALESGDPDVFKQWERMLPRALKNVMRGIRVGLRGEETSRSGAAIADFDVTNTADTLELAGYMLGFTPTKLTEKWDLIAAQREAIGFWALQRQVLFDQFYSARKGKDREALADVREAIDRFNSQVPNAKLRISTKSLLQSIKSRQSKEKKLESGDATSKTYQGLAEDVKRYYPEVDFGSVGTASP